MDRRIANIPRSVAAAAALVVGTGLALAPRDASAAFLAAFSEVNNVGTVADLLPSTAAPGTNASDATGIDFVNNSLIALAAGGDLAPIAGATGTIQDIAEGAIPLVGPPAPLAIANFYTLVQGADSVVFDLGSITGIMRDPIGLTSLTIDGAGTLRATIGGVVYDPTPATYTLTVQGNGSTTFSSSTVSSGGIVDVPEPASLALLGMGLMGMAAATRRRRPRA